MGRKLELLTAFAGALGLGLPLHAEAVPAFASQIRADLAVLSSEPTVTAWERSRPRSKIELAHYETEKDPFQLDFTRMNSWCAVSLASLPASAVRAALFYVPSAMPADLPPLPESEDGALIRACRMQAIWYQTRADIPMDALVNEFSSFWGKPNGQTITPDIPGSALWKTAVAWHRKGMNIWTVYDLNGKPGGTPGPRLIV